MSRNVIENVIADFYAKKTDDSRQNYLDYQAGLIDIFGNPKGSTTTPNTQTQTEVTPDPVPAADPDPVPDTGVAQAETDRAAKINAAKSQLSDALVARPNFYENRTQNNRRLLADEEAAKIVNTGENPYSFYGKDFNDTVSSILSSLEVKTPEIAPEVTPIDDTIEDIIGTPNMANKKLTNVKKVDGGYSKEVITTDPNRPMGSPITTTYFIPDSKVVSSSQGEPLGLGGFETDITVPENFEYESIYNPSQEQILGGSGYQAERDATITDIATGEETPVGGVDAAINEIIEDDSANVGGVDAAINEIIEDVDDSANVGGDDVGGKILSSESTDDSEPDPDPVVDAAEEAAKTRAGIKNVYDQLGLGVSEADIDFHANIYGPGGLNFSDQKDLTEQLRGNQLNRFQTALGLPSIDYGPGRLQPQATLDYSKFNLAPTAGIERLLPAEANRANTFYSLAQDPTFTAPDYGQFGREVEKARAADELGEGAGKSLFPLFGELLSEDYYKTTPARVKLAEEITPGIRAQAEADIAAEQAAAEGGMYAGGLATLSEANIYNKGGKVDDVGLHGLGQKMAAYGRYGDTMLAHISPEEAMMLKAMGGSGTINPATGLPEFFIGKLFKGLKRLIKPIFKIGKKILPAVLPPQIGIPLAAAQAGFKDGKFDLGDAIMAGAKTYAGGKIAQELGGLPGFEGKPVDLDLTKAGQVVDGAIQPFPQIMRPPSAFESASQFVRGIPSAFREAASDPGLFIDPLKNIVNVGEGALDVGSSVMKADFTKAKELLGPTSGYLLAEGVDRGMKETKAFKEKQKAIIAAQEEKKKKYRDLAASLAKQYPYGYAQGGVANLSGRYLDGVGDGMSDSIRANIEGQQEARLADGEFVVPADVVSDLGNGSSNAGAERLYSMMDRIRKARHGTNRQPPEVNVDKVMPV